ncbi:MAG: ABC transporter ATP-binding protein/permease [Bifidobacteriaceae bacterium]|jgi:ATP-binding cassette subfamily B protein|nr:ABC transporter ATP-binding protein/permease [Bifidobacteriaceae bacterium]
MAKAPTTGIEANPASSSSGVPTSGVPVSDAPISGTRTGRVIPRADAVTGGNSTGPGLFQAVRGRLGVIAALSLVGAATSIFPLIAIVELARTLAPAMSGQSIDEDKVWWIVGAAAGALIISFVTAGASALVSHLADNDLQLDLRQRVVEHLRRLPLGWFDRGSSGLVKKVVEDDISALHQLIAHAIQDFITSVTVPVIALVYLLTVDWRLALVSLTPLVAAIICFAMMMARSTPRYEEYDASLTRLSAATVEYVHGIAVVKAFGQVGRSHDRYRRETTSFAHFYDEWNRDTNRFATAGELVTSPPVVMALLAAAAAGSIAAEWVDPIDTLPALLLGLGLTAPLGKLEWSAQFLREGFKSRQSLIQFLGQPTVTEPDEPRTPADPQASYDQVSFGYEADFQVLHDITAACPPGTVTALVGPSGSGKTTLARLLPRFYDANAGRVAIGQVDVRSIASGDLYRQVGFVFQDVYPLRASLRDNIRLTRPDATEDEVIQAAQVAQIHDRIMSAPRGYDSVLGEDVVLSGGEAQRLTIARALITDAPLLVLDEATAFADPDCEAAIQAGLSALARQRTLLVIAHRLHTIAKADQILVVSEGRIVERGQHEDLERAGGLYQDMWQRYEPSRESSREPRSGSGSGSGSEPSRGLGPESGLEPGPESGPESGRNPGLESEQTVAESEAGR